MRRARRLEEIRASVQRCRLCSGRNDAWFFCRYGSVLGFWGQHQAMIVCPKPSTGQFPSKRDEMFYSILTRTCFSRAHLTDFIKCRGRSGSETEKEFENCSVFFRRELEVVNPKVIIAVGDKAYQRLARMKDLRCNVEKIWHYAYRFKSEKEVARRIEEQLNLIRRKHFESGPRVR